MHEYRNPIELPETVQGTGFTDDLAGHLLEHAHPAQRALHDNAHLDLERRTARSGAVSRHDTVLRMFFTCSQLSSS